LLESLYRERFGVGLTYSKIIDRHESSRKAV